jgi:hypothetical protein
VHKFLHLPSCEFSSSGILGWLLGFFLSVAGQGVDSLYMPLPFFVEMENVLVKESFITKLAVQLLLCSNCFLSFGLIQ